MAPDLPNPDGMRRMRGSSRRESHAHAVCTQQRWCEAAEYRSRACALAGGGQKDEFDRFSSHLRRRASSSQQSVNAGTNDEGESR